MINALIWMPAAKVQSLRGRVSSREAREALVRAFRDNVDFGRPINNGKTLTIMVREESEIDTVLAENNGATLVGAWDYFTGAKVRPLNKALYLNSQPDEVEYDEDGNVVSTQRPTERKLVNVWSGQAARDLI